MCPFTQQLPPEGHATTTAEPFASDPQTERLLNRLRVGPCRQPQSKPLATKGLNACHRSIRAVSKFKAASPTGEESPKEASSLGFTHQEARFTQPHPPRPRQPRPPPPPVSGLKPSICWKLCCCARLTASSHWFSSTHLGAKRPGTTGSPKVESMNCLQNSLYFFARPFSLPCVWFDGFLPDTPRAGVGPSRLGPMGLTTGYSTRMGRKGSA